MTDFPCPRCNTDQGWYRGPNQKLRCAKCFWERDDVEHAKVEVPVSDKLVKQPEQKVHIPSNPQVIRTK